MAQSWVTGSNPPALGFGNTTWYGSLGGIQDGEAQSHSQVDVPAGTFSLLYMSLNTNGGTCTAHFNVGNTNVNQALSATGGATGFFQDNTHSDTVSSGNKACVQFTGPSSGLFEGGAYGMLFDTSAGTNKATHWIGQGSQSSLNNTGAYYGSGPRTSATETSAEVIAQSPGTLSNIQAWSTNGFQTFTSRVATAAGAQSVTPGSGLWAEDNTHSDSVTAGQKIGYNVGSSSTDRTYNALMRFTSNDGGYDKIGLAQTVNTTNSYGNFNTLVAGSTETQFQELAVYQCKMTELGTFVDTSLGNGGNGTITIRKNATNGSNTASFTGNVTGWYQDSTHSDTFNAGDKYSFQSVAVSASNTTMTTVHIAPGVSTESGAVSMALGGIAFSITENDPTFNKHVSMALSGVAFSISGTREETAGVTLKLSPISFVIHGTREETATVALALGGIAISAFAQDLNAVSKLRQFHTFG